MSRFHNAHIFILFQVIARHIAISAVSVFALPFSMVTHQGPADPMLGVMEGQVAAVTGFAVVVAVVMWVGGKHCGGC